MVKQFRWLLPSGGSTVEVFNFLSTTTLENYQQTNSFPHGISLKSCTQRRIVLRLCALVSSNVFSDLKLSKMEIRCLISCQRRGLAIPTRRLQYRLWATFGRARTARGLRPACKLYPTILCDKIQGYIPYSCRSLCSHRSVCELAKQTIALVQCETTTITSVSKAIVVV